MLDRPYDLLITGVGGTGVVTIGALISMAAHLEGKGASVLDFTGFAQKFGPVLSFIRLAQTPDAIHQTRIDSGAADALIGCDIVVSSSPKASGTYRHGMRAVINLAEAPTGDIVRSPNADLAIDRRLRAIERVAGEENVQALNANALAEQLFGDAVFANMILLGHGWQQGLAPVGLDALLKAIDLNGVAVERNRQAFAIGRLAAADPAGFIEPAPPPETLDQVIARREAFLADYQDQAWARRYRALVDRVRAAEQKIGSTDLTDAVARALFKLMSYKDEYEVARLHGDTGFLESLSERFEGEYRVVHHLAPPLLGGKRDARGRPLKRAFGPWIQIAFRVLARMKRLRGTPFDVFGYTAERRMERDLIAWYEAIVEELIREIGATPPETLLTLARAPMDIRGYGPVKEAAAAEVKAKVTAIQAPSGPLSAAPTR
jgi:indolepyruvate ferredoxin oxidoreductase